MQKKGETRTGAHVDAIRLERKTGKGTRQAKVEND